MVWWWGVCGVVCVVPTSNISGHTSRDDQLCWWWWWWCVVDMSLISCAGGMWCDCSPGEGPWCGGLDVQHPGLHREEDGGGRE